MRRGRWPTARAGGFTYVGVLALVVLIGILLAAAGEMTHTAVQRQKEAELLWVGHQYREAIVRYVAQYHRYPPALADLLGDSGDNMLPFHAIRRLYRDPMTNGLDWVLIPGLDGGVMGVASASTRAPLKRAGFDSVDQTFVDSETYAQWAFTYDPNAFAPAGGPGDQPAPRSR
jgi:type II secretory pathway pseudopilin PulG